jgi:CRISPR-associated endonuclease/helicase Cas3
LSYAEFFKVLTGFTPHPYQERIQETLCTGQSLILRVPTGAGKTWAAVAPFLYSLTNGDRFADRLLYALPLRSLASSLHASVYSRMEKVFGKVNAVANSREHSGEHYYCTLQMGGQKDDVFFRGDVVFTTIDQLLSGYLFLPVSLPDRVGNINAGALIGSLIVFDEIHLLDSSVALGTVIEMLDRLRGLCQFVLMTATTSDKAISWLADRLSAAYLPVPDEEVRALPSQRTKQRTWRWSSGRIDACGLARQHHGGRTIVLLNSVQQAQDLFLNLERHYDSDPHKPHLLLLHARFYPEDRRTIEDQLPSYFGPGATKTNVILVTTQVIEAGMDISADNLHTELAPMNALIQRAGRTARYEDRPIGTVTVYEASGLGPYTEDKALVDATRSGVRQLPPEGCVVDFVEERNWVETVHAVSEESELKRYSNLRQRRDSVHKAMDQGERGRLSELVRNIDSIGVIVTPNPESAFEGRKWPRLLSVSGFSLMGLGRYFRSLAPGNWIAKGAVETNRDERPGITLDWLVLSAGQLRAQWLVAIHPDFASYHPQLGLRLGEAGEPPPLVFSESAPAQRYDYEFEPWARHCESIISKARPMNAAHTRGVGLLATSYGVPETWIEQLVEIACALHDVGKLTVDWQDCAWLWQHDKDARARVARLPVPPRYRVPIAHTEFNAGTDQPFRKQAKYRFPPHAVQGAFAVSDALAARFIASGGDNWGKLAARCVLTAIARHHGTRTRECTLFRFPPGTAQTVAEVVPGGWPDLELEACTDPLRRDQFPEVLLTFGVESNEPAWPLYAFLVRRLRLADQAATADLSRESS